MAIDKVGEQQCVEPAGRDAAQSGKVLLRGEGDAPGPCSLFLVDLGTSGTRRIGLKTIDPTRGQARLDFDGAEAEPLGAPGEGAALLARILDRAAVLMAFEQVGGADRALEMGRDYAMERFAFGRPIGSLQAIKHMLADMYVSATLARSNAYFRAWALAPGGHRAR